MKILILVTALTFGMSGAALACSDDAAGKPCACKDHAATHGAHHGKEPRGCMDHGAMGHTKPSHAQSEHTMPMGEGMDCCGKDSHQSGTSSSHSNSGRPGRAF